MWIILSLLTAFLISINDVLVKKLTGKVDPFCMAWCWSLFTIPYLYLYLFAAGIPPLGPSFLKAVVVSGLFLTVAMTCYTKAVQTSDLSVTVPMLAFTPALLMVTSPLIVGEIPGPWGIVGIVAIVIGSYLLNLSDRVNGFWAPFQALLKEEGPRYMLVVAVIFSISANIDKIGVINSSPLMWITAVNTFLTISLFPVVLWKSRHVRKQLKDGAPLLVLNGFVFGLAVLCQMTAFEMAIVPYVIALKRMSVLFSSLFGFFLFRERGLKERLAAALLMVLGVFLISFGA